MNIRKLLAAFGVAAIISSTIPVTVFAEEYAGVAA